MILRAKDGVRGKVTDLDTGEDLKRILWIDLDTGRFECYQSNLDGSVKTDANGNLLTYLGVGRFRFHPADQSSALRMLEGAERCSICKSQLTLPGSDLCAVCKANQDLTKQDRGTRECFSRPRAERLPALSLTDRCRCGRVAAWSVADESPASFVKGKLRIHGMLKTAWFARGMTVNRRQYCDFCFKPPRLLDERGEVIEEMQGLGPR